MAEKKTTDAIVKKRRNRPDLAKFGEEYAEPGDNSRYLRYAMVSWDLPPIDISDPKQVENRIMEYFTHCVENDRKPNMKGLGNWLGVSRDTVNSWKRGEYRSATHSDLIQKAVDVLEELWIDYMMNGKVNPGSGIFIGKNLFGYRDVVDLVNATPKDPLGEKRDPGQIASQYADLPED